MPVNALASVPPEIMYGTARAPGSSSRSTDAMSSTVGVSKGASIATSSMTDSTAIASPTIWRIVSSSSSS